MRVFIAALILAAVAGSASAQDLLALSLAHDAERAAADQAARQRDVAITNELSRLDSQVQTNQALAGLAAQRAPVALPTILPRDPKALAPAVDMGRFASIPDAALADSNAKVRAASANRK